jgi:hypothetical protein
MSTTPTTVPETTTAAPAAKKRKPMAAKKKTPAAPVITPISLGTKLVVIVTQKKKNGDTYQFQQGFNWYSPANGLIITARGLYPTQVANMTFALAEIAMALAITAKVNQMQVAAFVAKLNEGKREELVKTLYATVTGLPQEGMDAGVAPHLAELHAAYKANWAAFLSTPEGKELRSGKGPGVLTPESVFGFGIGTAAGAAKAAGGQQALSVQDRLAAEEARHAKRLAALRAAAGE